MSRSEALCAGLRLRPKMAIRRCVAMRGAMSRYVAMSRAVCPLRVYYPSALGLCACPITKKDSRVRWSGVCASWH